MKNPKCEVVRFNADDGYIYMGLLFRAGKSSNTVIHIHGMCGNMLSFSSLIDLADAYQKNGYNLLTFDLKAHDCIAEGVYTEGNEIENEFYYVGGSLETFERSFVDIQSAINFAYTFSTRIILQGHSMGCERIISYQITSKNYYDTILISPCDAYRLQLNYIMPKTIEEQLNELNEYEENQMLPPHFFGVNCHCGDKYTIPIYKKALHSILSGLALKVFRQDKNLEYYLPISCICLIGEKDPMQTYEPQGAFDIMIKKFESFIGHSLPGDHEMKPCQDVMATMIIDWLRHLQ